MLGWLAYRQSEASGVKERVELTLADEVLQWLDFAHLRLTRCMEKLKSILLLEETTIRSAQHSPALV